MKAALAVAFSARGFSPVSELVARKVADPRFNIMARLPDLKLKHQVGISDEGYAALRLVVKVVYDCGKFKDIADYSDIHSAVRRAHIECLETLRAPETFDELIDVIEPKIRKSSSAQTFLFPFHGLKVPERSSVSLGRATLFSDLKLALQAETVTALPEDQKALSDVMQGYSWLLVRATGTSTKAHRVASESASLIAGVLAALAACTFEDGATGFRIGVVLSPEAAYGHSRWAYWHDDDRQLCLNIRAPRSQPLEIEPSIYDRAGGEEIWQAILRLVCDGAESELEECLVRAIYWYSDANRETETTMQLVKYWSCVETFFGKATESMPIMDTVSNGLASLISFGPFYHPETPNRSALVKEAKRLYGMRSKAVHHGAHQSCNRSDVAKLSQYVAWMLLNVAKLREFGYTTPARLARQCQRISSEAGLDSGVFRFPPVR